MDGAAGFKGGELTRLRRAHHLTRTELAHQLGVSDQWRITSWENGTESPQPMMVRALARIFDVPPLSLLAGGSAPTLAQLREAAGLTRLQVGSAIGMAKSTYHRLDAGQRNLDDDVTQALADLLRCTPDQIRAAHQRSRNQASTSTGRPGLSTLRKPRSVTEVATALGIGERTWRRAESGHRRQLPPAWVPILAELFGVTDDEILAAHALTLGSSTKDTR